MRGLSRSVVLAMLLSACGTPEPEAAEGADQDTTVADTAAVEEAAALTFRPVWVHTPRADFPHGPHQRLECASCHVSVPNHRSHGQVECQDCHPIPAEVAQTVVPNQTECLDCHHVRRRALPCATCHEPAEVAGERAVANPMQVAAWTTPKEREFTFNHGWHGTLSCRECHEQSATNAPVTECRSCHETHHTPEATCARCHQAAAEGVHRDVVHQGCGGSGCHVNTDVLRLPPTRPLCLTCHPAQQDHEPGGDCATCHGIVAAWQGGRGP